MRLPIDSILAFKVFKGEIGLSPTDFFLPSDLGWEGAALHCKDLGKRQITYTSYMPFIEIKKNLKFG